jgi:hypothetical protein
MRAVTDLAELEHHPDSASPRAGRQQPAAAQHLVGLQRRLQTHHQIERDIIEPLQEGGPFRPADPVFGADAAAELVEQAEQRQPVADPSNRETSPG